MVRRAYRQCRPATHSLDLVFFVLRTREYAKSIMVRKSTVNTANIVIDRNEVYEREGEHGMTSVVAIFENHKGYHPSTRIAEDILKTMRETFAKTKKKMNMNRLGRI
jgi:hypothetical protein